MKTSRTRPGVTPVFMPERVYQLDEGGVDLDNLLFRGSAPLIKKDDGTYVFGYRALEAQLQKLKLQDHELKYVQ